MTNNTIPNNDQDQNTDTPGQDEANEATAFLAGADNGIETAAADASAAFRNSGDKKYLYDGRGRRPSTIL